MTEREKNLVSNKPNSPQNIAENKLLKAYDYDNLSPEDLKEKVKKTIALYNQMLYHMRGCACRLDTEHQIVFANKGMISLFGYKEEESSSLAGVTIFDLMTDCGKKMAAAQKIRDNIKITTPALEEFKAKDGNPLYTLITTTLLSKEEVGFDGTLINLFDITERRKAEEALLAVNQKYQSLFNNNTAGLAYCQTIFNDQNQPVDYTVLDINATYEKQVGIQREMIVGKRITEAFPGVSQDLIDRHNVVAVTGQDSHFEIYEPTIHMWFDVNVFSPQKGYFIALFSNITSRKKTEEQLRKSQERFEIVAEVAKVMVYEIENSTGNLSVFKGFEMLTGFKPDEIRPSIEWVLDRIHPDDLTYIKERIIEGINGKIDSYTVKYRFLHKSGNYITVQDTAKIIKDSKGKALRAIGGITDISKNEEIKLSLEKHSQDLERIVLERTNQLRLSERLAAIGATAGMIGHDIRNPLQAITNDVYLLKDYLYNMPEMPTKRDIAESLEEIEKNVVYIDKIVADLQDYSKAITPELNNVNLYELVVNSFRSIRIPDNVNPLIEMDSELIVRMDCTLFKRILTNLVINAIQAMPQGGKLSIMAKQKQGRLFFSIEDTGVGIPKDVKPKLFTPMMTTKAKGQGLGLAVVKRLVEALKGTISFESEEGRGTKFIIELPV